MVLGDRPDGGGQPDWAEHAACAAAVLQAVGGPREWPSALRLTEIAAGLSNAPVGNQVPGPTLWAVIQAGLRVAGEDGRDLGGRGVVSIA